MLYHFHYKLSQSQGPSHLADLVGYKAVFCQDNDRTSFLLRFNKRILLLELFVFTGLESAGIHTLFCALRVQLTLALLLRTSNAELQYNRSGNEIIISAKITFINAYVE